MKMNGRIFKIGKESLKVCIYTTYYYFDGPNVCYGKKTKRMQCCS